MYKQNLLNFIASIISDKLGVRIIFDEKCTCPNANIENGIITIPKKLIYDDISIAHIIHEASHLKYTAPIYTSKAYEKFEKELNSLYSNGAMVLKNLINIYEDIRIESLICKKFIGARSYLNQSTVNAWNGLYTNLLENEDSFRSMEDDNKFLLSLIWSLYNDKTIINQSEYQNFVQKTDSSVAQYFNKFEKDVLKYKSVYRILELIQKELDNLKPILKPLTDADKAMQKLKEMLSEMIKSLNDNDSQINGENQFKTKEIEDGNTNSESGVGANCNKNSDLEGETLLTKLSNDVTAGGYSTRKPSDENWISEDEIQSFIRSNINTITKRISIFKDVCRTKSVTNLKRGKLDTNKLYKATMSNRVFKKTIESSKDFKNTVVYILCDESGSMDGSKSQITSKAVGLFLAGLDRVGIKSAVYGFNCDYNVHKTTDERFVVRQAQDIDRHVKIDLHSGTENGYFLHKTYEQLLKEENDNKILVVFSDGDSCDSNDIYPADNIRYCDYQLKDVASRIEKESKVKLLSFGIEDTAVSRSYSKYKVLNQAEDLVGELVSLFKSLTPNIR